MTWKWDILQLDDDYGWGHHQILEKLHKKNIDCFFADMWHDDVAFLVGCKARDEEIARALEIHKECIYNDYEHCFVFINLFQEKYLRGLL